MEDDRLELSPAGRLKRRFGGLFNVRQGRASYEEIRHRFVSGMRIDGTRVSILIVAMLIASIGLNTDSTEAIIGAMLICPLMGSVLAISYSVATLDRKLFLNALLGLLVDVVFCLTTSTLYFVLTPISHETNALLANSMPTVWDLLIALAGGFAGGLGNSRNQEPATLISGVAVATALMPPLCSVGYYVAARNYVQAATAFYEFGINVVFIAFAAELVLLALKVPLCPAAAARAEAASSGRRFRHALVVATLIFAIPCIFLTAQLVKVASETSDAATVSSMDTYDTQITAKELQAICPEVTQYRVGTMFVSDDGSQVTQEIVATVKSSSRLSDQDKARLRSLIEIHAPKVKSINYVVDEPAALEASEEGASAASSTDRAEASGTAQPAGSEQLSRSADGTDAAAQSTEGR